jgi:CrcB protein
VSETSDAARRFGYTAGMVPYLIVFLGAGIGGALRHGVNLTCARYCGIEFPWGTMIINIVGSVVMGLAAGYFAFKAAGGLSQHSRLFLTTGILGGFTTFSTFSLDAMTLWERGQGLSALLYVVGSVVIGLLGLALGLALMRSLT